MSIATSFEADLVLPFADPGARALPRVGGKGARLEGPDAHLPNPGGAS